MAIDPFDSRKANTQSADYMQLANEWARSDDPLKRSQAAALAKAAQSGSRYTFNLPDSLLKDAEKKQQTAFNDQAEQSAFDESQGRSRELIGTSKQMYDKSMNDPTDQFIMDNLRQRATSGGYGDALFTQGADQAAAASGARWNSQQEQLAMRGLTPDSGAYQAAQNQNMMQRQQDVQKARLNATLGADQVQQSALQQMGSQQNAQAGRQQSTYGNYASAMKAPVGVRPGQQAPSATGVQPKLNTGTGSTYAAPTYGDFSKQWQQANAPAKPKTPFNKFG
jgi:hypothetical protein